MDIKTISSLKASSKELSNNATLDEIDLRTSEIPKSESRVGENEENAKITEVQTSENPTSRVRHSTEVKTSEFLTSALLKVEVWWSEKSTLKRLMNMHMNVKMLDFIYLTKSFRKRNQNIKLILEEFIDKIWYSRGSVVRVLNCMVFRMNYKCKTPYP